VKLLAKTPAPDVAALLTELAELDRDAERCRADLDRAQEAERQAVAEQDTDALQKTWTRIAEFRRRLDATASERARLHAAIRAALLAAADTYRAQETGRLAKVAAEEKQATEALNTAIGTAERAFGKLDALLRRPERQTRPWPETLAAQAQEADVTLPAIETPVAAPSVVAVSPDLGALADPAAAWRTDVGARQAAPEGLQEALTPHQRRTLRAAGIALSRLPTGWQVPGHVNGWQALSAGTDWQFARAVEVAAQQAGAAEADVRDAAIWLLLGEPPALAAS